MKKSLKTIITFFNRCGNLKLEFTFAVVLTLILSLISVSIPAIAGYIVDGLNTEGKSFVTERIGFFIFVLVIVTIIYFLFSCGRELFIARMTERSRAYFQKSLYKHLQYLGADFFTKTHIGEITSRLTYDIDRGVVPLLKLLVVILRLSFTLICSGIYLFYMSPIIGCLFILFISVLAIVLRLFFPKLMKISEALQKENGKLNDQITGCISVQSLIRSFAREGEVKNRLSKAINDYKDNSFSLHMYWNNTWNGIHSYTIFFAPIAIIIISSWMLERGLTIGELVSAYAYWGLCFNMVNFLSYQVSGLVRSLANLNRIFEFFNEKPLITDSSNAKELVLDKGEIIFDNITFSYPAEKSIQIINKLNLHIKGKESLAIVGETGAGKSTLLQLLYRVYNLDKGRILIDGQDLCDLTQKSLRSQMGIVMQDNLLFSGTIRENMQFVKENVSDDEIIEALKNAQIWSFINETESKLDTLLGERGIRLSEGQKQRIAIARIFLQNPPIIVLDEATSSVDSITEKKLQRTMEKLMKGRTTITIAHRLSTIINCDKIALLDKGILVELGTHEELLKTCKLYQNYCKAQKLEDI